MKLQQFLRKVHWWLGRGWSASDFSKRYRSSHRDAWGYLENADHHARLSRMLEALPAFTQGTILELGCAEGFITRELASRCSRVVACDFSREAVDRAKRYCDDLTNVEFLCADIRDPFHFENVSLCLASDVLYYLTAKEIRGFAFRLAEKMTSDGKLVFANEWHAAYRELSAPETVVASIIESDRWRRISDVKIPIDDQASHTIVRFEVCDSSSTDKVP